MKWKVLLKRCESITSLLPSWRPIFRPVIRVPQRRFRGSLSLSLFSIQSPLSSPLSSPLFPSFFDLDPLCSPLSFVQLLLSCSFYKVYHISFFLFFLFVLYPLVFLFFLIFWVSFMLFFLVTFPAGLWSRSLSAKAIIILGGESDLKIFLLNIKGMESESGKS